MAAARRATRPHPTAIQFTPDIAARDYAAWLKSLRRDAGMVSPICTCLFLRPHVLVLRMQHRRREPALADRRLCRAVAARNRPVADTLSERLVAGSVHFWRRRNAQHAGRKKWALSPPLAERFDFPKVLRSLQIDPPR